MSRRKKNPPRVNHERWLVSYADFITLLFAFFVVLYASSQVDKRKVGKLAMAIQVAFQEMGVFPTSSTEVPIDISEPMPFSNVQAIENMQKNASVAHIASHPEGALGGGKEDGDLAQLETELESTLAAEIRRKEIAMRREPDGLVISLREVGFFESGSAQMKAASEAAFDRIATLLRERNCRVRIEGHTDNVPIHNAQFSSNWELSTSRATEIVRILIVRDGYSPNRLSAAGYAEFHPIASNDTVEGRSTNRRVDIVVLGQEAPAAALEANTSAESHQPKASAGLASSTPTETKEAKPSPAIARLPAR
jgi:chemotaxis protein MotB